LYVALFAAVLALMVMGAAFSGAASAAEPSFSAHGSVEQVYVTGATPGEELSLVDSAGSTAETKTVNSLGGLLFRNDDGDHTRADDGVPPGSGYRVRASDGTQSDPLTVLSTQSAPPSTDVYDQTIPSKGYGYLTTRDGTKLSINVHPPEDAAKALGVDPPQVSEGSTPTLIEYSGYGYANPDGPDNGISVLANLMGFTVVDVNMRGTGCSGGAFDFFEPLQNLDGYDVIETVARQPWVKDNKVGMMGISYGGISQMFTAQTQPPSLAAIAPMSVIDSTQTTLYPGGILNTGFAVPWAQERQEEAKPAPDGGQAWASERIQEGDDTCKENQVLHPEAADLMAKIRANDHYWPEVADPLTPRTFVDKVNVPVFMVCQWQDEQTGGHCPTLAKHFTGTDRKWFTFTNGTHVDALAPETYNRWCDFLALYVAKQPPVQNCTASHAAAPAIYQAAMGIPGVTMPPDPIQLQPTYEGALAAFERLPSIRVLFDNGAGGKQPGEPQPGFEHSWPSFPIPGTTARSWYLADEGALSDRPPDNAKPDSFKWDRSRPLTNFKGDTGAGPGGLWTATPNYDWVQSKPGRAVSYLTSRLSNNTTVIGGGAVQAWVRSSTPNVDLQATVTEVRPDGKEVFVQNGWVRANKRKLDPDKSTQLEPVLSLKQDDVSQLPQDQFVEVTIPLYYQGHAYRAGSRIRVTITAPNGDQPIWSFSETDPSGTATVDIAHTAEMPSRLLLPVVSGADVPTGLPPCPGLRGQPCRDYRPLVNRTTGR
jgi:uncharacterized protein